MFPLSTLSLIALSFVSNTNAISFHPQYEQLSTDLDQPNRFLCNAGPFNEAIGFGIPTDVPDTCTVEQAHLFMREGARFPGDGNVEEYDEVLAKLQNASLSIPSGPLGFATTYGSIGFNATEYGTDMSFIGYYSGANEIAKLAAQLRSRYNHLVDEKATTPLFAAAAQKVYDTARVFGNAFFFGKTDLYKVFVFDEDILQSANTLTSANACPAYDDDTYDDYLDNATFAVDYDLVEAARLNRLSPGFNFTDDDVWGMSSYCAFELNARGESKFCDALSREFFITSAYDTDLGYFYGYGPGYNMSKVAGGLYVNATAEYIKQGKEAPNPLTFQFTHETILLNYITALGIFDDETTLPIDTIQFDRRFHTSQLIPMGGRVITERLACTNSTSGKDDIYVRVLVNNKVTPIPDCYSGPGFSCPLDDYLSIVEKNVPEYASNCNITSETAPRYLSYLWDWENANYSTNYVFDF